MATTELPVVTVAADPKDGQVVEHESNTYTTIREGRAFILVPPNAKTAVDPKAKSKPDDGSHTQNVFYNPIQQFNRDLSVLAIKAFGEDSCQRKRQKHESQYAKDKRKAENKRKRGDGIRLETENHKENDIPAKEAHSGKEGDVVKDMTNDGSEGVGTTKRQREDEAPNGSPSKIRRAEDGSRAPVWDGEQNETEHEQVATENVSQAVDPVNGVESEQTDTTSSKLPNGNKQQHVPAEDGRTQTSWKPRFRILDALSATGLRALRYASEIPFATTVVANDRERSATDSIKLNVEHNRLASMIKTNTGDALGHMYSVAFPSSDSHGPSHISGRYDVIDLDPYGTAAPFIDAALQALEDGGLLCVTCTDSGVFASCGYSEKTFALYGGLPIKGLHSHEGGLRLMLHSIATTASKYGLAIEPLLSLSIDYYARLFVRVRKSPADVKFLAGKTMLVYSCDFGCGAWTTQPLGRHNKHKGSEVNYKYTIAQAPSTNSTCEHCGSKQHLAGPMWGGLLHNPAFVEKLLSDLNTADSAVYQTKARMEGMLDTALDELIVNHEAMDFRNVPKNSKSSEKDIIPRTPPEAIDHHPFFFVTSALCKVIKAQAPAEALIKGALRHAGYRVTRSHCKPGSIKTDAPWNVVWEVFREWVRQRSPIKEGALQEMHAGYRILQATRTEQTADEASAPVEQNGDANVNGGAETNGNTSAVDTPEIVTDTTNGEALPARPSTPTDLKKMKVVFDEKLGRDKPGRRLVRYQENPRENWGPMRKAQGAK